MQPDIKPTTPGQRIRAIRLARGISQVDAAQRAGVSQATWSAIERDESSPTVERAQAIATTLGATVDELWPAGQAA